MTTQGTPTGEALGEAVRRIAENAVTAREWLDLGDLLLIQLPDKIKALRHLKYLSLGGYSLHMCDGSVSWKWSSDRPRNQLTDLTPLEGLTGLIWLDLSNALLENTDLTPLSGLTGLGHLSLRERIVSVLSPLGQLTALTCLDLSGALVETADLSPLSGLTALTHLDLMYAEKVRDLSPLSGLRALTVLNLRGAVEVRDLSPLTQLIHLAKFSLDHCKITDLSPLSGLRSLAELDLFGCYEVEQFTSLSDLEGLVKLNLTGCDWVSDLTFLARLTRLTWLSLANCYQVSDLTPLSGLKALEFLACGGCGKISDLSPLSGLVALTVLSLGQCRFRDLSPVSCLTSLTRLDLQECQGITDFSPILALKSLKQLDLSEYRGPAPFAPLTQLLPGLDELRLYGCDIRDLPSHLTGISRNENVAGLVRSHYDGLEYGNAIEDLECKVLLVGNAGAGKTSLARLILRPDLPHQVFPPTHAIELGSRDLPIHLLGGPTERVRVNLWDFGGQDIYHQTHRLFFQSGSVYIIVWDPCEDGPGRDPARSVGGRRPLQYWVDQVISTHPQAHILIVRNKADLDEGVTDLDWRDLLPRPQHKEAITDGRIQGDVRLSASDRSGRYGEACGRMFEWLGGAVSAALGESGRRILPRARLDIKKRIRKLQAANDETMRANEGHGAKRQRPLHAFVERAAFRGIIDECCNGRGLPPCEASDTDAVLTWLHRTGVVFWDERLFGDRVVLDQRWVLQGLYTLLDTERVYHHLRSASGRFTPARLREWAWDEAGYDEDERRLFLAFMSSCGLCFPLDDADSDSPYTEYLALEYLPLGNNPGVEAGRGRLRAMYGGDPAANWQAASPFLGEGVARTLVNGFGRQWGRDAAYWKWGVAFAPLGGRSRAVAEATWRQEEGKEDDFGGQLDVSAWGPDGRAFLDNVVNLIRRLPGFPAEALPPTRSDGVCPTEEDEPATTPPASPPKEPSDQADPAFEGLYEGVTRILKGEPRFRVDPSEALVILVDFIKVARLMLEQGLSRAIAAEQAGSNDWTFKRQIYPFQDKLGYKLITEGTGGKKGAARITPEGAALLRWACSGQGPLAGMAGHLAGKPPEGGAASAG